MSNVLNGSIAKLRKAIDRDGPYMKRRVLTKPIYLDPQIRTIKT